MPEDRPSPNFSRYPMLWLAASFALGILTTHATNAELSVLLTLCAAFAILAIMFRESSYAAILILISFAAAGAVSATIQQQSVSPDRIRVLYDNGTIRSGDPVEIEGVLSGRPESSVDSVFLDLRAEKVVYHGGERTVSGNVRLFLSRSDHSNDEDYLTSQRLELKYGSRLRIACTLEREYEYLNPGVVQKKEILDRLGIDATGSIKSELLVEKIADESVLLPLAWIYDQRGRLIDDFRSNLSRSPAGVMIASMLGDKFFLDKDTADLFRDGGTFHILVISGMHITFIGGLLLFFVRRITRNRWVQLVVTSLVLWSYTLAVGADVPVVRAAVMFTIVIYSYVIYRQGSVLNSLGACGLIVLVWRPSDLFNPSFQLTFVSVAAIVAGAYPLIDRLRRIGSWTPTAQEPFPPNVPGWLGRFCEMLYWNTDTWKVESKRHIWTAKLFKAPLLPRRVVGGIQTAAQYLFEGVLVSLVVQIWMLPLLIVYFHRVSAASVVLNLWVGIFIALESFVAVMGALVDHFSSLLASPFFSLAEIFNWLMLLAPRVFSSSGWASFRLPAYSGTGRTIYGLYFLLVLFAGFTANRWNPLDLRQRAWPLQKQVLYPIFTTLIVLTTIIIFHPFSAPRPDARMHLDFLDVGQGDSALVTLPDGETLLIDGGGTTRRKAGDSEDEEPFEPDVRRIGEAVVSEFLWDRGYSQIDHILATHADADHIQGLTDVAKSFGIGSAIFGRTPTSDPDFAELAAVLTQRGIPVEVIARGDHLKFGEVNVEVLYPLATDDPDDISDNDHSVVLRLTYGSRSFLLTGDVERQAESALINNGGTVRSDLIKVGHHGSRTSSTQPFVEAVGSDYAVISVGRSSPFGHPHPEVVERWRAAGATVMTTGERGTIFVSTDGKDLEITTFVP